MTGRRRIALAVVATLGVGLLWRSSNASIFGEENATLIKQLAELMQIHEELQVMSEAAQRGADVAEDIYELYDSARAGVDELKSYSTDKFLNDLQRDVYNTYPGFELLARGADGQRVQRWRQSRARSPFTTYEMISAVFGDLTDPLKQRSKEGQLRLERAAIWRYEAAGALALANDAEAWTESADKDAQQLYALAAEADADQAQHLSARALALIAVQNSHVIRLLSRNVRFDGIRGAMQWSQRVQGLNDRHHMHQQVDQTLQQTLRPPKMVRFPKAW